MKTKRALLALSAVGLISIAGFESYTSTPYQDAGGVWTNGFGNTHNVDPDKTVSIHSALFTLRDNITSAEKMINDCVHTKLTQGQFDALVSLAYNVGNICETRTIRYFNVGEYQKGCEGILTFDKVRINGRLVSCQDKRNNCYGIVKRRVEEYKICSS